MSIIRHARVGRHNPFILYDQIGEQPSNEDYYLAAFTGTAFAQAAADAINSSESGIRTDRWVSVGALIYPAGTPTLDNIIALCVDASTAQLIVAAMRK